MTNKEALYNYSLRMGDNALILGHRLSEWCSKAPIIEEDLALTNVALDMIGRAQAFLKYAAIIKNEGLTEDDLAYRRTEKEYHNHLITEQPNGDFAHTIARQLYISVFEYYFFSHLEQSTDVEFAAIAAKAIKEVKYHREHASDWTIRLGDGTEESRKRMQTAINNLWMWTAELFEMDEVDITLLKDGISVDLVPVRDLWKREIEKVLLEATLEFPGTGYMQSGSRKGIHTENMGHILSEMQYLQRAYPDAKW